MKFLTFEQRYGFLTDGRQFHISVKKVSLKCKIFVKYLNKNRPVSFNCGSGRFLESQIGTRPGTLRLLLTFGFSFFSSILT